MEEEEEVGGHNMQMTVFLSTLSPITEKLEPHETCTQYPKWLLEDRE